MTTFGLQGLVVVTGTLAARLLGVTDRGRLALLWVIVLILAQVGTLAVPSGVTYFIAAGRAAPATMLSSVSRLMRVQAAGLTIVHAAVLWLIFRHGRGSDQLAAAVTLPAVPALVVHQYGLAVLQGTGRFRAFNALRAFPLLVYAVGIVIAFILDDKSLALVIGLWVVGVTIGGPATFLVAASGFARDVTARVGEAPPLRETVRFGARALLGAFSASEQLQLDQAIVGLVVSTRALGLYVVAVAVSNLPRFVGQSIGIVAFPSVARASASGHARAAVIRFAIAGTLAVAVVAGALELVARPIVTIFFGSAFGSAVGVTRILLAAAFVQGVRRVLSDAARGAGQPGLGTMSEIVLWVFMVPGVALAAPSGGLRGVAIAVLIASGAGLSALLLGLNPQDQPEASDLNARSSGPASPEREHPLDGVSSG